MARLKHTDSTTSFFPFLNVLLCLVGALLLGVLLVSIGRLSVEKVQAREQVIQEEYQGLRYQAERTAEAIEGLEARQQEAEAARRQLAQLRSEVKELEQAKEGAARMEQELRSAQARVSALQVDVDQVRRQRDELRAIRDQQQVKKKELPKPGSVKIVGTARMVGQQDDLGKHLIRQAQERLKGAGFDPGPADGQFGPQTVQALRQYQAAYGLAVTGVLDTATRMSLRLNELQPYFAECSGNHVIVHPSATQISVDQLERNDTFRTLVERVKSEQNKGAVLILMIRQDGVETFNQVHAFVEKQGIRYGFLPIPGFGDIDLSAFGS